MFCAWNEYISIDMEIVFDIEYVCLATIADLRTIISIFLCSPRALHFHEYFRKLLAIDNKHIERGREICCLVY